MSVKCQVIIDAVEKLAPRHLAEEWDNVGLLIGSPSQSIKKILITLDVTTEVVTRAIDNNIDMIIAHHPLIFKGITKIRTDLPQGQVLANLLKADIAVYAAHTNLDIADGGVNDVLAAKLNLKNVKPLTIGISEKLYKLAVFVPKTHIEQVRTAITNAGAGHIGNYSNCTFQAAGTGTFLPLEGTNPFIGEQGKLEYVEEYRLETIMPEKILKRIIKAMIKAHPYEEVAYDIYPLINSSNDFGLGRIGERANPSSVEDFISEVKQALNIKYVKVIGNINKVLNKVAVCGGSGACLISKAAFAGADVFITGDVKYHEAQAAVDNGIVVIDAGHFATEQPVVSMLADYLTNCRNNAKWAVDINIDENHKEIFNIY